jgi:hypothetical protein
LGLTCSAGSNSGAPAANFETRDLHGEYPGGRQDHTPTNEDFMIARHTCGLTEVDAAREELKTALSVREPWASFCRYFLKRFSLRRT